MEVRPLAERMRPRSLKEFVGQDHLLGKDQILREIIEKKKIVSLIFWGPPGSGKTTLARIIANEIEAEFIELSAVSAGKADVMKVIDRAKQNKRLNLRTILFVDEIHRFNKAQQDAFLPCVEDGTIILIGATTENPSFEVINPLLSRSKILTLEPIPKKDIVKIINQAIKREGINKQRLPDETIDFLAETSGGDARIALSNLELALELEDKIISIETIKNVSQKRLPGYDKNGEYHYDIISAFIKSMRGSDANASLYYLARMLNAGEDPKFIARRMVIFASEDVGIASSPALNLAVSTFEAVEKIGMPECQYNLFHCALVLSKCQKSRVVADVMIKALDAASKYQDLPVPLGIRNAPTNLMKNLGYGSGYKWQANFQVGDGFLPEQIKDLDLFK